MSYTFKDDGASLTYYREYNKEVGTGDKTLVGNWVEERALREAQGTGRYPHWVSTSADPTEKQKTFTKFTTRPDVDGTYQRTLVHSDHTPSADFVTSNNVQDPGYSTYVSKGKGAREALLEQRAWELAAATARQEPEMPPQYHSTHLQDFVPKDLPAAAELGRRVMMTQNMQDIKGAGDGTWRKEAGLIDPSAIVESTDTPAGTVLTSTGLKPAARFQKDATFSTPIYYYQKGQEKD